MYHIKADDAQFWFVSLSTSTYILSIQSTHHSSSSSSSLPLPLSLSPSLWPPTFEEKKRLHSLNQDTPSFPQSPAFLDFERIFESLSFSNSISSPLSLSLSLSSSTPSAYVCCSPPPIQPICHPLRGSSLFLFLKKIHCHFWVI